ncbi:MAG TPA: hypothetical protein VGF13_00240, partial [Verrucomicrobiae bacterium]
MNALRLLTLICCAGISVVFDAHSSQHRVAPGVHQRGRVTMKPCPCPCPQLCRDGETTVIEPVDVIVPPVPAGAFASFRSHRGCTVTLPAPASASGTGYDSGVSGWTKDGYTHTVRVYSFIDIGGTRYFSATFATASVLLNPANDENSVLWTWPIVSGAHGYFLTKSTDDPNYPFAFDFGVAIPDSGVTANYGGLGFIYGDASPTFWTAPPTVTPNSYSGNILNVGAFSSQPISQWADLTGNGHHLLQATLGRRPLFKPLQFSGYPAVRFDGADDRLLSANFTNQTAGAVTIIACLRVPSVSRGLIELGNPLLYRSTDRFLFSTNGSVQTGAGQPVTSCI